MLDKYGNGFLPVVDNDEKLIGIITDGDLRRGILNKNLTLQNIINFNPKTKKKEIPPYKLRKKLIDLKLRHMPIVDDEGKLIEIFILNDFKINQKPNWVVIMAGGLGTRLGELTKDVPKPMLEVGGKPILLHIINNFKSQGFSKFILCVNYKSEIIENYFGNGSSFGVEILYTKESKRMGTAGALSLIDIELNEPFLVVNGDLITEINYLDFLSFHVNSNSPATMCIKRYTYELPYACVSFDKNNTLLNLQEKPINEFFINTGMYILNPQMISLLKKDEYFDMPSLFEKAIENNFSPKVFVIDEYWLDIGQKEDFRKAQEDIRQNFL